MTELIQYLNSIHPLSHALEEKLTLVLSEKNFLKKEYLLKAGQVCRIIYFIKKGLTEGSGTMTG
jgi:hypothetical protein